MKITITKPQLIAIINMCADMEAMIGENYDNDRQWRNNVRHIKRMLVANKILHKNKLNK